MELLDAILKRRSQRKFTDYVVTDKEVEDLLEAARWAPSWANTQVWEFVVVRDKMIIEKIVSTYTEKNPATKCTLASSVVLVGCAKLGVSSGFEKGETIPVEWSKFDLGCAVQNLCLRAYELELGTVVVASLDHKACKDILKIPDGYEPLVVLPLGKPVHPEKTGPPRKAVAEFSHLNTFGNPYKGQ